VRLIAGVKVYDDTRFLEPVLEVACKVADEVWVTATERPWRGDCSLHQNEPTRELVKRMMDTHVNLHLLVQPSFRSEEEQINDLIKIAINEHCERHGPLYNDTYYWYLDADELYHETELQFVKEHVLGKSPVDLYTCSLATYFKHGDWVVSPPEPLQPGVFFLLKPDFEIVNIRSCSPHPINIVHIPPSILTCHHMSYVGTDEEIKKKISYFSHSHEIVPNWFEEVWMNADLNSKNLHPTHPSAYAGLRKVKYLSLPAQVRMQSESLLLS